MIRRNFAQDQLDAMEHSMPVKNPGMEFDIWELLFTVTAGHGSL